MNRSLTLTFYISIISTKYCIQRRTTTAITYKIIISIFFYYPKCTYRLRKSESKMAALAHTHTHTHIHTRATVRFSCETSLSFWFVLPESKYFLVYVIFRTPTHSLCSYVPPTRCTWIRLLSSMPPTQLMRHFLRRILASCLFYETGAHPVMPPRQLTWHFRWGVDLFTLRNKRPSCYAIHKTYVTCQSDLSGQYSTVVAI